MALYFFYFFAFTAILSSFFVIFSNNPVHSVLWLIVTFFSVAGFFILVGAEFLALLLMIVYVGALAVLFLFVVMMLNINFSKIFEIAMLNGYSGIRTRNFGLCLPRQSWTGFLDFSTGRMSRSSARCRFIRTWIENVI